jgi:hypothetical protein
VFSSVPVVGVREPRKPPPSSTTQISSRLPPSLLSSLVCLLASSSLPYFNNNKNFFLGLYLNFLSEKKTHNAVAASVFQKKKKENVELLFDSIWLNLQ